MANIHLVAIAKTLDWKEYGYKCTLEVIEKELQSLATKGVEIVTQNCEKTTVYACLVAVNGDNLGRHTILGLVESFRATHFCAQCMAEQNEIQMKFLESDFRMRTKTLYEEQLDRVLSAKSTGTQQAYDDQVKQTGIKVACSLNNVSGWHLTNNKVADLMHDFLGMYAVCMFLC